MTVKIQNECPEHATNCWRLSTVEGLLKGHLDKCECWRNEVDKRFVGIERTIFRFGTFVAVVNAVVGLVVTAVTMGNKFGWF
jgi:hypothetical protein